MLTDMKTSPLYDPNIALEYAKEAVKLKEEMDFIDTLIEAYVAVKQKDKAIALCESMLKKYPKEKMLLKRLKQLK